MPATIVKDGNNAFIELNGDKLVLIRGTENAEDSFEKIEEGAWRWHRKTAFPTDHMRMEAVLLGKPDFTMIPSISYNGNGWGDVPEYVGDRCDGIPWTFAWHRSTIPSCTYSENPKISFALMAEAGDNTACSLYLEEEGETHVVIYPEEEQPKTLQRHFWSDGFQGSMEPATDFTAIILAVPSNGEKHRYKDLLDFAWRYYGHPMEPPMESKELYRLSLAYSRFLFEREKNGFAGFTMGSQWHLSDTSYHKTTHRYEIGWVGQSASMANAFIYEYMRSGNKEDLDMALEVHDSWLKFGKCKDGLISARIDYDPWRYDEYPEGYVPDRWKVGECLYETLLSYGGKKFRRDENGQIKIAIDACNIGTAAEEYFEAWHLLKDAGIDRPEYREAALGICDFALGQQDEEGCFAKSWDEEGRVLAKKGTVGCFLVLGLIIAYKETGEEKYIKSAKRAFDFYYGALVREGFTTAGALDTYSIDKESSSPLLRDALALYDLTEDKAYLEAAEKIAWYLCTWMMHFTIKYPADSVIGKMGYDTFGSTSVSTPHQALDQYALRDVLSFLHLYELTGYKQWLERGKVFWYNASQCISDGTMYINGRLRPAGAQDEAIFHTRWGRHGVPPFMPSQWLPAWPIAFRLEDLRRHPDWTVFDEGLKEIEGQIAK